MNIIISPSKTMQFEDVSRDGVKPIFLNKTLRILEKLRSFSIDELGKLFKIKGKLLDSVYSNIQHFDSLDENIAIKAYTGMVFKGLKLNQYDSVQWDYLNNHVVILSAFYGVLKPNTLIKPYRLDFNAMSDLYELWCDATVDIKEPIINLASNEYSKMVNKKMINIGFREYRDGKYKNIATYSKQARGAMLNYLILNKVETIEDIKRFSENNYSYNIKLSDDYNLIFTR